MSLTYPHDFSGATSISGAELQQQFDAVANKFGALTAGDLSPQASILTSQLEASFEHMDIALQTSYSMNESAAWPASGVLAAVPVVNRGLDWVVSDIDWICSDTGDGAGAFRVQWAEFAAGAYSSIGNVCAATTMANAAAANDSNSGMVTPSGTTTLAQGSGARFLALIATAAGVGVMSAAGEYVTVTCRLKRRISSTSG
jgi:hypothetical protein